MTLIRYTLQEREEIKKVFSQKDNAEQRKELAKKLDKSMASLVSKYRYDLKHIDKGIVTTHVLQPFKTKTPVIVIDNKTKIIMPTNKFTVNGIRIEC